MRVTMLLADAAQVVNGKLYILGGGWTLCGPEPTVMALAIKLEVLPDEAGRSHDWSIVLLDESGMPATLKAPDGSRSSVEIAGKFERISSKASEFPPDAPLDASLAVNVGPIPLQPGRRFVWQFSIDGQARDDWRLAFRTRSVTGPHTDANSTDRAEGRLRPGGAA
jgi:hypothetical protein